MVSCIVIDDDPNIVNLFSELLALIGVDVLATGYDGNEAVKLYEKFLPDVVFVDLIMPEFDGVYAVKKIKESWVGAKIIIVTADLQADQSYLLDSLKVNQIIYKPFDMNSVKNALNHILLN